MKKIFLTAITLIVFGALFFSCKKDKESTAKKLQHNWSIVNEIDNFHDASGDHMDTIPGVAGDYINFSSNGTVTSQFDGTSDNSTYTLTDDTHIVVNSASYTIKTLTDKQFVLYIRQDLSSTEYEEQNINLKR